MGIYDRDYYREPTRQPRFGNFSKGSVTTWIIAINVLIFVIDAILRHRMPQQYVYSPSDHQLYLVNPGMGPLQSGGYFSVTKAITDHQFWRFLSFQFLHANIIHLFSNMLGLYFFGPIVERFFGAGRYIAFYLFCGCSGALSYMLLLAVGILHGPVGTLHGAATPLVGASAGIFGVLIAGAMIAPNITVLLLFPPIPIKFKYLALILVAWATYIAVTNGDNAGGQAAHLGGAVLGFIFMRYPVLLKPFAFSMRSRRKVSAWSNDFDR